MLKKYFYDFARKKKDQLEDSQLFVLLSALKNHERKHSFNRHLRDELTKVSVIDRNFKEEIEEFLKEDKTIKPADQQSLRFIIESMQVSDFKGFGPKTAEHSGTRINFNDEKTIFFAPNGGGKSSLCNALEYELTGQIKEAKRRGLSEKEYAYSDRTKNIILTFKDKNFNTNKLNDYQKSLLENAFIEHNRINAFALLGSNDSGDRYRDVISTILGLEDLEKFISYFIQPTSVNLDGAKTFKASEKLQSDKGITEIQGVIKHIKKSVKEIKSDISNVLSSKGRITRRKVKKKIEKLDRQIGEKDKELNKIPIEKPIDLNGTEIMKKIIEIKETLEDYDGIKKELGEKIGELELNNLYESILVLEDKEYDHCPACQTELEDVEVDPFKHAKESLEELSNIREKNNKKKVLKNKLENEYFNEIKQLIAKYNNLVDQNSDLRIKNLSELLGELADDTQSITNRMDHLRIVVNYFKGASSDLNLFYEKYKQFVDKYNDAETIRNRLEDEKKKIVKKKSDLKNYLNEWESELREIINKYNNLKPEKVKRKKLKEQKEQEEKFNNFIDEIQESYEMLYRELTEYKNKIERERIVGTEGLITDYYQRMNIEDQEPEMVQEVRFELEKDKYTIKIEVDGKEYNAFSKLSEGHLRTLGLSILLAIAKKNDIPVLIFDDIVNAIDAEHRANIIELMYEDSYLKRTQIIVTTHDRLFWERFCNKASNNKSGFNQEISHIMNYTNKGNIIKQYNVNFHNKIIEALEHNDIRQALVYCRIWFETIILDFCQKERISIKGNIRDRSIYISMTPVLNKAYSEVVNYINKEKNADQFNEYYVDQFNKYFNQIKNDLINWGGQNQEHHAFSEASYNFVHAKTSSEITDIYQAIFYLKLILFPKRSKRYKKRCKSRYGIIEKRINDLEKKLYYEEPINKEELEQERDCLKEKRDQLDEVIEFIGEIEN